MNTDLTYINQAVSTCIDMLIHRGYTHYNEELNMFEHSTNKLMLFILPVGKLTLVQIRHYISKTTEYDVNHCIILVNDTITPIARKHISEIPIKCEVFTMSQLQYNITKHKLVPKHTKLTPNQAITIKEKYGKNEKGEKCLPRMYITDPMARFLGLSVGDVVRIERNDGNIVYRMVV